MKLEEVAPSWGSFRAQRSRRSTEAQMENSKYKLDNTFPKKNGLKLNGPDVQKSLGIFTRK